MKVLILCTGNSCRSRMAHGSLQSFNKNIEVYSGGTVSAKQVNAKAVEVMEGVRTGIASHVPTHVNTYLDKEWDYAITVCDDVNESCPMFTGRIRNRLHIGFNGPLGATGSPEFINSELHRVQDETKARFYDFHLNELKPQLR